LGLGYQFEQGHVLRVDSQFIHFDAVNPTLAVLSNSRFQWPHQEFFNAHELCTNLNAEGTRAQAARMDRHQRNRLENRISSRFAPSLELREYGGFLLRRGSGRRRESRRHGRQLLPVSRNRALAPVVTPIVLTGLTGQLVPVR
jgi:hypothetical protein